MTENNKSDTDFARRWFPDGAPTLEEARENLTSAEEELDHLFAKKKQQREENPNVISFDEISMSIDRLRSTRYAYRQILGIEAEYSAEERIKAVEGLPEGIANLILESTEDTDFWKKVPGRERSRPDGTAYLDTAVLDMMSPVFEVESTTPGRKYAFKRMEDINETKPPNSWVFWQIDVRENGLKDVCELCYDRFGDKEFASIKPGWPKNISLAKWKGDHIEEELSLNLQNTYMDAKDLAKKIIKKYQASVIHHLPDHPGESRYAIRYDPEEDVDILVAKMVDLSWLPPLKIPIYGFTESPPFRSGVSLGFESIAPENPNVKFGDEIQLIAYDAYFKVYELDNNEFHLQQFRPTKKASLEECSPPIIFPPTLEADKIAREVMQRFENELT